MSPAFAPARTFPAPALAGSVQAATDGKIVSITTMTTTTRIIGNGWVFVRK